METSPESSEHSGRGFPTFLRSFDLPEPGELRRVARVYVWGRWFVLSIATFAWLYPLNVDEVVYAPNVALAALLFATNGYLHYRLATERTVSWRWMLALSALDLAMLSGGGAAHRGFESPFFVGYYPSLALFAMVFGSVRLTLVWVTMAAAVYAALCLAVEPGLDFSANDEEILLISPNPPKDTDGRREDSGRGVRELPGRWPGLHWGRWEVGGRSSVAAQGPYGRLREL